MEALQQLASDPSSVIVAPQIHKSSQRNFQMMQTASRGGIGMSSPSYRPRELVTSLVITSYRLRVLDGVGIGGDGLIVRGSNEDALHGRLIQTKLLQLLVGSDRMLRSLPFNLWSLANAVSGRTLPLACISALSPVGIGRVPRQPPTVRRKAQSMLHMAGEMQPAATMPSIVLYIPGPAVSVCTRAPSPLSGASPAFGIAALLMTSPARQRLIRSFVMKAVV